MTLQFVAFLKNLKNCTQPLFKTIFWNKCLTELNKYGIWRFYSGSELWDLSKKMQATEYIKNGLCLENLNSYSLLVFIITVYLMYY